MIHFDALFKKGAKAYTFVGITFVSGFLYTKERIIYKINKAGIVAKLKNGNNANAAKSNIIRGHKLDKFH